METFVKITQVSGDWYSFGIYQNDELVSASSGFETPAEARWAAARTLRETGICSHPPARVYSWLSYDGTLCVACRDCGEILAGGV